MSTLPPTLVRARWAIVVTLAITSFGLGGSVAPPASAQPAAQQAQPKEPVQPTVTSIPVSEIAQHAEQRSEERRVGKECRSRGGRDDHRKKTRTDGDGVSG